MNRVGKRVLYVCSKEDEKQVEEMRQAGQPVNPVNENDILPGTIVADWGNGEPGSCVNVSVILDGAVAPLWKTSIMEGTGTNEFQLID